MIEVVAVPEDVVAVDVVAVDVVAEGVVAVDVGGVVDVVNIGLGLGRPHSLFEVTQFWQ